MIQFFIQNLRISTEVFEQKYKLNLSPSLPSKGT
jgi:hypothetical protein